MFYNAVVKSWKTTLAGAVMGGTYAVLTAMQAGTVDTRDLIVAAGLAILGYLSKDATATHTQP